MEDFIDGFGVTQHKLAVDRAPRCEAMSPKADLDPTRRYVPGAPAWIGVRSSTA